MPRSPRSSSRTSARCALAARKRCKATTPASGLRTTTTISSLTRASTRAVTRSLLFRALPAVALRRAHVGLGRRAQTAFLFNEHFVVKPGRSDVGFRWHTDAAEQLCMCEAAGVSDATTAYVSLWIALDDADEQNGCVCVHPARPEDEDDDQNTRTMAIIHIHVHIPTTARRARTRTFIFIFVSYNAASHHIIIYSYS